ncbi:MAG TPA: nitronate monooxygenase [Candidatus Elarobacter sp.]|nr:nitronate monooxygenase [Dongiaceae bacterium]HZW53861.1 nitronate monooxygenase [Candidatus Elarobacter sp.]
MQSLPFLDVPIVQAPMSGPTTPELVAAVSNAGGLGSLPGGYDAPEAIRAQIARVRALTDRPFAVNLFVDTSSPATAGELRRAHERLRGYREELGIPHPPEPPAGAIGFREQFDVMLEARPAVFSFTFGIPDAAMLGACRAAGIFTIGTAKTVDEAVALERAGVDAVCVQGYEAGGHHGNFLAPLDDSLIGTLALVPQAVDAVKVPVLAAGGIGDGRGVAAVLALGAAAAQVGSAFLLSDESGASPVYRRTLASDAVRRTTLTRVFSGKHARGVRNRFIDEMTGAAEIASYPHQHWLTRDIRTAATAQEKPDYLSMWTGQAVALAKPLPAATIVASLLTEARAAARRAAAALAKPATTS